MEAFDWDEYFESKMEIRFSRWKNHFDRQIVSARDRMFAASLQLKLFYKYIDNCWSNGRISSTDCINNSNDPIERITYFHHADLYAQFDNVWQLHSQRPVYVYVRKHLPSLLKEYRSRLLDVGGTIDDKLSASNFDYCKDTIGWIAGLAARDRVCKYLQDVDPERICIQQLTHAKSTHTGKNNKKEPKKETTQSDYKLIAEKVKYHIGQKMSKKDAMAKVRNEMNKTQKVVYNALAVYAPEV